MKNVAQFNDVADKGGVYRIRNKLDGTPYIGSTNRFKRRRRDHECSLRKGKHENKPFQNAWDKYGEEAFIFEVLEVVEETADEIIRRTIEQRYIDEVWPNCYNVKKKTIQKQGPWSSTPEETRKKLSEALTGRKFSEETKRKMSKIRIGKNNPNYGKHPTEETRNKLSQAHKGKPLTEDHKRKIGKANKGRTTWMKGRKHTEESRHKTSETMKSKQRKGK